jgi:hypothetical protein
MKIEPGKGKGGRAPVVVRDKEGLLYGWTTLKGIVDRGKGGETFSIHAELEVFLGYIKCRYKHTASYQACDAFSREHNLVNTEQLKAIDAEIALTVEEARTIQALQDDLEAGLVDEWLKKTGRGGLPPA